MDKEKAIIYKVTTKGVVGGNEKTRKLIEDAGGWSAYIANLHDKKDELKETPAPSGENPDGDGSLLILKECSKIGKSFFWPRKDECTNES